MMESTWSREVKTFLWHFMTLKEESKSETECIFTFIDLYRKINTYYNKNYGVDLVRFTHHNKCILCASKRDSHYRIMYWSLHDNNILCSFIGHTDSITTIDLNP